MIRTINDVEYDESIWLKLSCGGRDKTMYVYLPIQGTHVDWVYMYLNYYNCSYFESCVG